MTGLETLPENPQLRCRNNVADYVNRKCLFNDSSETKGRYRRTVGED